MKRTFLFIVILLASVNFLTAQSRDINNPTKLKSNEISGSVDSFIRGNKYYYSFFANPGELSITLTVEPGRRPNSTISFTTVGFALSDQNGAELISTGTSVTDLTGSKMIVKNVEITRRQRVMLVVDFPDGSYDTSVGGKYRIRIEGAVEFSGGTEYEDFAKQLEESRIRTARGSGNSSCLPKTGTLIVKMKDGTKKIIDLSEAETVTIVP